VKGRAGEAEVEPIPRAMPMKQNAAREGGGPSGAESAVDLPTRVVGRCPPCDFVVTP
jgi:hypothetical protein